LYPNGEDRNEATKRAKASFKAKDDSQKGTTYLSDLSQENYLSEQRLLAFESDAVNAKKAEEAIPLPPYETRSGATMSRPQVSLGLKARNAHEALDLLVSRMTGSGESQAPIELITPTAPARGRSRTKTPNVFRGLSRSKSKSKSVPPVKEDATVSNPT
jgi:hypothetical protein